MKKKSEEKAKDALKAIAGTVAAEVLWRAGGKKIFNSLVDKVLPVALKSAENIVEKHLEDKNRKNKQ